MQPGKREVRLGLHPSGREHRHAPLPRSPRGVRQEPRLADTRLAAKHERLATSRDLVQHDLSRTCSSSRPSKGALHREPCRA